MPTRRPLELNFNVVEDGGAHRGEFDVELGDYGEITSVTIGGAEISGMANVCDLFERLLGEGFLIARSEQHKTDFENDSSKSHSELELEVLNTQRRDVL